MTWEELERSGALRDMHRRFEAAIPAESLAIMDSFTPFERRTACGIDPNKGYDMGPMFSGIKMYVLPNAPPGVDPCYFIPDIEPGEGGCWCFLTPEQRNHMATTFHEELGERPGRRLHRRRQPRRPQQGPRQQKPRQQKTSKQQKSR